MKDTYEYITSHDKDKKLKDIEFSFNQNEQIYLDSIEENFINQGYTPSNYSLFNLYEYHQTRSRPIKIAKRKP